MKNETEQKRGHLVRKMTLEKKETANDAHGGVRHKKGMNQARSETKSPVCVYTHTAYVGWCTGGPPRSHLIVQCRHERRS